MHQELDILRNQLADFFRTSEFSISPIPGGASSRRYFKITFREKNYFPSQTVLLMQVPDQDSRLLQDHVNINYYFKRMGINTPRIFEVNLSKSWVFLHFETSPTVEHYLHTHPAKLPGVVRGMVNFISEIQQKCKFERHCPAFHRRFDDAKYQFEFDFHVAEQLLRFYFQLEYAPEVLHQFSREICSFLDINENVFVHRDFQSSNVFLTNNKSPYEFSVIDFQDARYGTPVYDLVSCLWDSYIPISANLQEELVEQFFHFLPKININWEWDYYRKIVDYTIIQRKLHDAGAFAYNYRRFASRRYVGYVNEAVVMALDVMRKYSHFKDAITLFEKCQ
jgi:aminoglycoside/choline kinase family phosphotransferase